MIAADNNEAKKDNKVDCVQPPLDFTSKWSMAIPSIHDKSIDLNTCMRWLVPVNHSINNENNTI